jgi:hypothetical protein
LSQTTLSPRIEANSQSESTPRERLFEEISRLKPLGELTEIDSRGACRDPSGEGAHGWCDAIRQHRALRGRRPGSETNTGGLDNRRAPTLGRADGRLGLVPCHVTRDLKQRPEFARLIVRDLHARGFLSIDNLGGTMSGRGIVEKRTTALGDRFLDFVMTDPREGLDSVVESRMNE